MDGNWNGLPIIVFGTGATSKEAAEIIRRINAHNHSFVYDFLGFVSNGIDSSSNMDIVCSDEDVHSFVTHYKAVGAVAPFLDGNVKEQIYNRFKGLYGLVWPNIIDPDAKFINRCSVKLGIGNVIECGATININVNIGSFNLININSIIGHDCHIGDFCAINPGAVLSGGVTIKNHVLIGAGAAVKQNLLIGQNSTLGLGAFAVEDIEQEKVMVCAKATDLKKHLD